MTRLVKVTGITSIRRSGITDSIAYQFITKLNEDSSYSSGLDQSDRMDPWWRGVPFFIAGSQLHLKHV
jgi:hypothetical protein